jgi:hypothetical protein
MIIMISIVKETFKLRLILLTVLCDLIHDGTWILMIPQQFFLQRGSQETSVLASPFATGKSSHMYDSRCMCFLEQSSCVEPVLKQESEKHLMHFPRYMAKCLVLHSTVKIVVEYIAHIVVHKPLQKEVDEKAPRRIQNSGYL